MPGKYVIAVSGGVDSMTLLDVLCRLPDVEVVVAHFDHGIRKDSEQDRRLVEATAARHGLSFVWAAGRLGAGVSEATARAARYAFLRGVQRQVGARAIVMAHHRDDVLETAIFNLLRGTGRKGLASLRSRPGIIRPFIHIYKDELLAYAQAHNLVWREDSTNSDEDYARNYIRRRIVPRLDDRQRQLLETYVTQAEASNQVIDQLLEALLPRPAGQLDRGWFIMLPHQVAREVMAAWLRQNGRVDFDRKAIERLVAAAKVALPGKRSDIAKGSALYIGKDLLKIR